MRKLVNVVSPSLPTYPIELERFGSYSKLITTTALVLKCLFMVVKDLKDKLKYDYTYYSRAALMYWIRFEQLAYYPQEVKQCSVGKYAPKVGPNITTTMRSFRLFKDNEGVLRLSSRIQDDYSLWETSNPILLPSQSRFTTLYIQFIHKLSLHAGSKQTLVNIRKRFWVSSW